MDKLTNHEEQDTTTLNLGEAQTVSIGTVETMKNTIGKVENQVNNFYGQPPRPINKTTRLTESEGGLSSKQRIYFKETIDKVCELGKITKNPRAIHKIVRNDVNIAGGVTSVDHYPAAKYWAGVIELEKWLSSMMVHEEVLKNPPEWWESHAKQAVHIYLERNGTEEAFREWLSIRYGVESMDELNIQDLAEVYKARKNKFSNPKEKVHPRDFENRLDALNRFLDDAERKGAFNRMNIPLKRSELLEALQATDRTLFSIADSTFETFLKEAKKKISFKFKTGTRPKARNKCG